MNNFLARAKLEINANETYLGHGSALFILLQQVRKKSTKNMNRSVHALVENTCSLPACQLLVGRTVGTCNVNSFTRLFIGRQRANHVGEGELLVKRQPLTAFKWISYSDRTERPQEECWVFGSSKQSFFNF